MINISVGTIKVARMPMKMMLLAGKLELVERVANQRVEEGDAGRADHGDQDAVEIPAAKVIGADHFRIVGERRILRQKGKLHQFGRRLEAGQDHPDKRRHHDNGAGAEQQVGKEHFPSEAGARLRRLADQAFGGFQPVSGARICGNRHGQYSTRRESTRN
jgi:hypothetical protein